MVTDHRSSADRGRTLGILLGIAIAALLLRLPSLFYAGLWRDEGYLYVDLTAQTFGQFLHRVTAVEFDPPLFFLIAYAWTRIAGISELSLKLLPLIFSILTVPAVYALGKAAATRGTGFLAAVLFAVSPLPVMYSTVYVYPFALLVFTLAAWTVTKMRRLPLTFARYASVAVSLSLAVYSHYLALIFAPLLAIWALTSPRGIKHGVFLASAIVVGSLAFVFWFPVFWHQHEIGLADREPLTLTASVAFAKSVLLEFMPVRTTLWQTVVFSVIVLAALVLGSPRSWRSDAASLGLLFLAALFSLCAAQLTISRYVLPFSALLYVGIANALTAFAARAAKEEPRAWRRWGVAGCAVLGAFFVAGDTALAFKNGSTPESGIRTFVRSRPPESQTLYVLAPDYIASSFAFYARGTRTNFLGFARLNHPELYTLDGYEALWAEPALVGRALQTIAYDSQHMGYIDLVVDERARDSYHVPYGKTWTLLRAMGARYRLLGHWRYPGRWESIAVYRFKT
jgi:4-amino-4-deoxy-L-arabinose transferase-like glycosyltransferase